VGDKADTLRVLLEEPAFLKAQREKGATMLTVVKLGEHEIRGGSIDEEQESKKNGDEETGTMPSFLDCKNCSSP
jgi:hypothetical protein